MTIQEWTDINYPLLGAAIGRITEGDELSQELLHYTLVAFLERGDAQQIVSSGGGFFYCLKIATNSWKSTTSPFYRQYRDPNPRQELKEKYENMGEDFPSGEIQLPQEDPRMPTPEEIMERIDKKLGELSWYERELTRAYAEHNCNAKLLSRVTNIPRTSINLTLKRVRAHIKKSVNNE